MNLFNYDIRRIFLLDNLEVEDDDQEVGRNFVHRMHVIERPDQRWTGIV